MKTLWPQKLNFERLTLAAHTPAYSHCGHGGHQVVAAGEVSHSLLHPLMVCREVHLGNYRIAGSVPMSWGWPNHRCRQPPNRPNLWLNRPCPVIRLARVPTRQRTSPLLRVQGIEVCQKMGCDREPNMWRKFAAPFARCRMEQSRFPQPAVPIGLLGQREPNELPSGTPVAQL
jgi:hypothetical protein